ncbi:hypothetical protein [Pseudomonas alabamensis]|uniref:hypothetical protein n=1 Tax=Pseudomonas alabamensis TaxID=3064349 RepID=UPI000745B91F|nr:energy transducer TonB [Pseudomonas monteilii]
MSDTLAIGLTYLSPVDHYGRHNTQALGGVSHLWSDFFARALSEQQGSQPLDDVQRHATVDPRTGEPVAGSDTLALIRTQRDCEIGDRDVRPPEPLFLPKAELEADLLEPAAEPFSAAELIAQQRHLEIETQWQRPTVMRQGHPLPLPGDGPAPRPLHLPIAEFDWSLLDEAPVPFDEQTLAAQTTDLAFDAHWARPVVLNNVRLTA